MARLPLCQHICMNESVSFGEHWGFLMALLQISSCNSNRNFMTLPTLLIGMNQVHAFLMGDTFYYDMNIGKVSLKEQILRAEF